MNAHRIPSFALAALLLSTLACNFPTSQTATNIASTALPSTYVLSVPTPLPSTASPAPMLPILPTAIPAPSPTMPFADAGPVLAGVCYSYLQTLNNQALVFKSPSDLTAFYNQVDRSKRCTDAVARQTFDFSANQIVGTVITGQGCGLDVTYDHVEVDDAASKRTIVVKGQVKGTCPYDLVRPLWLVVDRSVNTTAISVIKSP